jgi:hypothetical protein
LPCQSTKCPYTRAGACALVRDPRARRTSLKGGVSPRTRRTLLEGGGDPRARRTLLEGGGNPRARRTSLGSGVAVERGGPRSRGRFAGPLRWAARAATTWIAVCVCFVLGPWLGLHFAFFAGFKQNSPRFFRGSSWLSPTGSFTLEQPKLHI